MNCKNCKTDLLEDSDYCYSCGGRVIRNRLTMGNLFAHFSETFFNYDNKFFQTFINLFKKPEDVIDSYINGTRKKYVDVISYFALAVTITGLYVFVQRKFFPDIMDYSMYAANGQEEMQKEWVSILQEYNSIFMMLYVPFYAILARITFLGLKKYNYTELLVVFMYIQAQLSLTSSVLMIPIMWLNWNVGLISFAFVGLMILYSAFCLKRLYDLNLSNMILRTLIFLALMLVFWFIVGIIMFVVWYLNGNLDTMIEAQRAAKQT
ncbi:DUF3667 domain-containing protein [Subsaxibacter sp. CAU 1640]|uniref:DUF3667 domain-containing protein n=1 Tax=Subsaxibacter sp. CAU 1640 TaxID=2933271 RepID=UPI002006CAB1|nr:DUF3667 domain-containing protein [Subsaxibacter sp. CAU 1640]MCK7591365.1 DUF3667 domain-containing protein [Subsaxibacter sp. CAU 1640]